ncbi:MAG: hypothetical protein BWY83_00015 [bacterium ADurb.Bin478]|nr:MAG: hypothetical protein BWY83_00015 [bacterium ADurb.Bin478]
MTVKVAGNIAVRIEDCVLLRKKSQHLRRCKMPFNPVCDESRHLCQHRPHIPVKGETGELDIVGAFIKIEHIGAVISLDADGDGRFRRRSFGRIHAKGVQRSCHGIDLHRHPARVGAGGVISGQHHLKSILQIEVCCSVDVLKEIVGREKTRFVGLPPAGQFTLLRQQADQGLPQIILRPDVGEEKETGDPGER